VCTIEKPILITQAQRFVRGGHPEYKKQDTYQMNIFFLSWDTNKCAELYCDQHVIKILLEIVQMLYTAWHVCGDPDMLLQAPPRKDGTSGYKPVSNRNHAMVMWVRSSEYNYVWTSRLGMSLAIEFNKRFNKIHSCSPHIMWLSMNIPPCLTEVKNLNAHYSLTGFPSWVTSVPQCMPEQYRDTDLIIANYNYYRGVKLRFARWKHR